MRFGRLIQHTCKRIINQPPLINKDYRVKVSGSQQHITAQKYTEYALFVPCCDMNITSFLLMTIDLVIMDTFFT